MPLYDRDYMRPQERRQPVWLAHWTPLHWIIAVNVAVFIAQNVFGLWVDTPATSSEAGRPLGGVSVAGLAEGRFWTAITYMFVHQNLVHLLWNLLLIGMVGNRVQALLGPRQFTLLYFLSGLVGAASHMAVLMYFRHEASVEIIGASASACGLLLGYAAIMPEELIGKRLYFIIPLQLRVWTVGMLFLGVDLALGLSAMLWPVAHAWWGQPAYFAHLGGALTGWYFVRMLGYNGFPMTSHRLARDRLSPVRQSKRRQQVARVRRERAMPVIDEEALRRRQVPGQRNQLPIMENVNDILDKINRDGLPSLSDEERNILESASREIARREGRKQS